MLIKQENYWNLNKFASYQETRSKSSFKSKLFKTNKWSSINLKLQNLRFYAWPLGHWGMSTIVIVSF